MLPVPTVGAVAAFVGCIAMLGIGIATGSGAVTVMAGGAFVSRCA